MKYALGPGGGGAAAALDRWQGRRSPARWARTRWARTRWARTRLQQLVAAARVDVVSAQFGLGRHCEVLPEVSAQAATYPLWEDVQALFMTALYGNGRVADADAHYRRARPTLVNDFGIEPGPWLHETTSGSRPATRH